MTVDPAVIEACVIWDCQKPATLGVWCAAHAGEAPGTPGIVEPALEARLAAMPDPPSAPMLDQGDRYDPPRSPSLDGPHPEPDADGRVTFQIQPASISGEFGFVSAQGSLAYIQSCLAGRHGAVAKMVAESMVKAVATALADL
jgi:hypothetical protein